MAYLGQSIEFRCVTNETSKFTRIQHRLPNGTIETLLSNEYLNNDYNRTEIHVEKYDHFYLIRINPVKLHSAGVYVCEDDISQQDKITHNANITVHVSRNFFKIYLMLIWIWIWLLYLINKAGPKQSELQNYIKFAQYKHAKVPYQYGRSSGSSNFIY